MKFQGLVANRNNLLANIQSQYNVAAIGAQSRKDVADIAAGATRERTKASQQKDERTNILRRISDKQKRLDKINDILADTYANLSAENEQSYIEEYNRLAEDINKLQSKYNSLGNVTDYSNYKILSVE